MARLKICSARVMRITPTSRNTACATIAAAAVRLRGNRDTRGGRGDCQKFLAAKFGIVIRGCLTQMGDIPLAIKDWDQVEQNPFFCPDPDKIDALDELMRGLKKKGDSIGAKVTVVADGVPRASGELGVRPPGCRYRPRADEHQRGERVKSAMVL